MKILARVREHVPDLTLTIIGTWDRHSRRYHRSLTSLAASLGPWIEFRDNLTRDEVRALMAAHRYGIHGMREEHFGMAPAETGARRRDRVGAARRRTDGDRRRRAGADVRLGR